MFIFNLSVSDVIVLVFALPFRVSHAHIPTLLTPYQPLYTSHLQNGASKGAQNESLLACDSGGHDHFPLE